MEIGASRIFITENEINGLAFPDVPGAVVIFGLGYGLDRLSEIEWLTQRPMHYWGDIDTHGFAMLDRVRAIFPAVQSLLMDRSTLEAHSHLWVLRAARVWASWAVFTPLKRRYTTIFVSTGWASG